MRKQILSVVNLIFLFFIFFFLGGTFWLWKGRILNIFTPPSESLPLAVSFEDIKKSVPNPSLDVGVSTTTPALATSTPEVTVELPKEINLAVPFTSQAPEKNWDQPWQDACEEAAVLMMEAYYGNQKLSVLFAKDEILKMVKWEEEEKLWGRSIEIEKVQDLVQYYMSSLLTSKNLKTKIIENPTVEQIKKYVAAGTPVLVVADGKILPNNHFQNGGPEYHALVIRGYTETEFITNDPGTQFGENFKYTYNDLMKSIRDWNAGDVKNGRRVVLVIE